MDLSTARFSGHQSFAFRNTWLTKGVAECARNPAIFRESDALVIMGVGKNMVDSIKYWCLATRVIEDHPEERYCHRPTRMGQRIFVEDGGWDPYLEDEGTLWLLHWLLATHGEYATTIYYAFNELTGLEFSRGSLSEALLKVANLLQVRTTEHTVRRDVNVLVRSYLGSEDGSGSSVEDTLDCPLAELGLLYEQPIRQTCAFHRGPKDGLPDAVFCYALWEYAQSKGGQASLTFDELAYFPASPGRVFKLDEPALAERLEHVAELTHGAWQLTETAGYRQVTMRQPVDAFELLGKHYVRCSQGSAHG